MNIFTAESRQWDHDDMYNIQLMTDEAATFRLVHSLLHAIIETGDYRLSMLANHNDVPLQNEPTTSFGEGRD